MTLLSPWRQLRAVARKLLYYRNPMGLPDPRAGAERTDGHGHRAVLWEEARVDPARPVR